jgi:hypothetical protein
MSHLKKYNNNPWSWQGVYKPITNSIEQSPSLKANSSSASQEILRILSNKMFITGGTISHHLSLSCTMSVQFTWTPPYFLKVHFKIILTSTRSYYKRPASFPFAHPNPVCTSPIRAKCPTHLILLNSVTEVIFAEELFFRWDVTVVCYSMISRSLILV